MAGMWEVIPSNKCFKSNKARASIQGSLFCHGHMCHVHGPNCDLGCDHRTLYKLPLVSNFTVMQTWACSAARRWMKRSG